ncbi:glutathione peroxidase [Candidatus Pelagibacter sp.]|jgi:glutathione peroxidase|nr:glutathione peroxidase [Candidatus Pelagibacter sp.]|tara:strand:- start:377 stop:889 length:513 start_codon:yes stop_codon:yes gene_type:complete
MFSFSEKVDAKYEKLFFDLSVKNIDNKIIDLSKYKGKTVLLVNVASNCGFTKQYSGLQELYEKYKEKNFIVLGVPSNQFGGQEPGSNSEIKNFCETNFNITFPITDKIDVKGNNAHIIYKWAKENHGNSTVPKWNFHKILINKEGKIHDTFGSFTEPLSNKIKKQIELIL